MFFCVCDLLVYICVKILFLWIGVFFWNCMGKDFLKIDDIFNKLKLELYFIVWIFIYIKNIILYSVYKVI